VAVEIDSGNSQTDGRKRPRRITFTANTVGKEIATDKLLKLIFDSHVAWTLTDWQT